MSKIFGYVKAYKPEMKIKEYETYKSIYCSLCRNLSKNYGVLAKFTLNYDFVFWSILLLGIKNDSHYCFGKCCCRFNPLKKCTMLKDDPEELTFVSSVAMIMTYYKLVDDIHDEKFFRALLARGLSWLYKNCYNKANARYPEVSKIVKDYILEQNMVENTPFVSIDRPSHPSSNAISKLLPYYSKDENTKRILERLGYFLGKWIYLIDAADDLFSDIKKNSFNPFINKYDIISYDEFNYDIKRDIESSLNYCISEISASFELLDIKNFKEIIKNIIYLGFEYTQKRVLFSKRNKRGKIINNERSL